MPNDQDKLAHPQNEFTQQQNQEELFRKICEAITGLTARKYIQLKQWLYFQATLKDWKQFMAT